MIIYSMSIFFCECTELQQNHIFKWLCLYSITDVSHLPPQYWFMDFWFQNFKFWFLADDLLFALLKGVTFEGYYILAGSAKLIIQNLFRTPRNSPLDVGISDFFPNWNEMGKLGWRDSGDHLYSHRNSNWRLWMEGARKQPFPFKNNSYLEIPTITMYLCQILVCLSHQICTYVLFWP